VPSRLYVLSSTGAIRAGWPQIINATAPSSTEPKSYPALGDLDGDGDLEIVIGAGDGRMLAFHHTGVTVAGWPQPMQAAPVNTPVIGDIDGDGKVEVIAGNGFTSDFPFDDALFAWHGDGTLLAGWPVHYDRPIQYRWFGFGSPALADLDGDGRADVIVSSDTPQMPKFPLNAYRFDGTKVPGFPKPTIGDEMWMTNTAAIADFDGDGKVEVSWLDGDSNLYLWDLPASSTGPAPWPMFGHDPGRTSASPAAPRPAFFSDDFEDGNTDGWTFHSGTWSIATDGTKVLKQTNLTGNARASNGSATLTDQVVEARIKPLSWNGTDRFVALFARFQNENNYYYVTLRSSGKLELKKLVAGQATALSSKSFSVQTNTWYRVKLSIVGTSLKAYVNGNLELSATDSTYASGKMGVGTYYASASFDDIVVTTGATAPEAASSPSPADGATGIDAAAPPALSWTAGAGTTSHDVYFGTANPPPFRGNQTGTSFNPGPLSPSTTYFWRVDERNASGVTAGATWRLTTAAATTILLSDDFNSGSTSKWSPLSGSWSIVTDGTKAYSGTNTSGNARSSAGSSSWTDQTIVARVKPVSFSGTDRFVAVFARFQDASNYYYVTLRSSGKLELKKLVGGAATTLASKAMTVTTGTWYTVKLQIVGTSLKAYVNGVLQASATDTRFTAGKVGLGTYYATARFDDVVVSR
jgi:hypothetical protein